MEPEQVEQLLIKIERLQSIMIDVATGESDFQDEKDYYTELYQEVELEIELLQEEGLTISNPNSFTSLSNWCDYWSSNLETYALRQRYIYELYLNTIEQLESTLHKQRAKVFPSNSIPNWETSRIEKLVKKIEHMQSIMIDVATRKSKIEDEEETYIQLYRDVASQIYNLKTYLPITNPNYFRSLHYWLAYCLSELETYQSRQDFISNLYTTIVSPIKKALHKNRFKANLSEEFVQDLKNFIIKVQSTQTPTCASVSPVEAIKVSNQQNIEVVSSKADIQDVTPVFNQKPTEQILVPILMTNPQSSRDLSSDTVTDVVIITALPKERDAVLRYLDSPQAVQSSGKTFHTALIKTQKSDTTYQLVILCLPAMGNLQAAVATQRAIADFNPSHIILAGIAGGVPKDNSRYLGDILVGEQVVYYELGKQNELQQGGTEVKRRYEVYRPARVLLDTAKNLPPQNWVLSIKTLRPDGTTGRVIPQVHFGVVASGDKVIADPSLKDELQSDWSKLVGVEMEGAGTALAAYESDFSPGVLLVKGMCDWADGSKNDDWQEYAAEAAASFVIQLLKSAPFESRLKPDTPNRQEPPIESKLTLLLSKSEEQPQVVKTSTKAYSGQVKRLICERLFPGWEDLADEFKIPSHQRHAFKPGRQAHGVWEWLEQRNKLDELEAALIAIGRDDLVKELNK